MPDPRYSRRAAQPKTCPTCGRLTLRGLDHHRIAATVTVDPYQLNKADEATAVIAGVATYELRGDPPTWELNERTHPGLITIWPLTPADECTVVAAHQCNTQPISGTPLPTRPPARPAEQRGEPPY